VNEVILTIDEDDEEVTIEQLSELCARVTCTDDDHNRQGGGVELRWLTTHDEGRRERERNSRRMGSKKSERDERKGVSVLRSGSETVKRGGKDEE
jgi:hypothetical protein